MVEIKEEVMRDGFVKQHLLGLGFDAVIHQLSSPDIIGPHDHPYSFTTTVLKGWYKEIVYVLITAIDDARDYIVYKKEYIRKEGYNGRVGANTIHEIIECSPDCTTIILPEVKTRDWGFWKFENNEAYFRYPNEGWVKQ